jgi:hypothetical protein
MDNQTDSSWLIGVSNLDLGTGLFVFPSDYVQEFGSSTWSQQSHSAAFGSLTKALVREMNYLTCVEDGRKSFVIAFKWVPQSLASFDVVKSAAGTCGPVLCVRRCAGYGCLCIAGECK